MYDEDVIREDTGELYVIQHSGSIKEIVKPAEPGWIWKNGHWFFVRNKKFRKGYIETGGNSFYFYGNGQMAVDTVVEGYGYADPTDIFIWTEFIRTWNFLFCMLYCHRIIDSFSGRMAKERQIRCMVGGIR